MVALILEYSLSDLDLHPVDMQCTQLPISLTSSWIFTSRFWFNRSKREYLFASFRGINSDVFVHRPPPPASSNPMNSITCSLLCKQKARIYPRLLTSLDRLRMRVSPFCLPRTSLSGVLAALCAFCISFSGSQWTVLSVLTPYKAVSVLFSLQSAIQVYILYTVPLI